MKPTMTIIGYLYSGRNTWLRHDDGCKCPPSEIINEILDQVLVEKWLVQEGEVGKFLLRTADEWDDICGPKAEARILNKMAESYMGQAAEIIAVIATKERLSSE